MAATSVNIVIATFKRPQLLRALLGSIAAADKPADTSWKILVIDNDPLMSAQSICLDEYRNSSLIYISEPKPGISAARNAGILASLDSDFIIFVDDDEVVSTRWLTELLAVQQETKADIVAGPVHSVLPESVPKYIHDSGIFDRPRHPNLSMLGEAGTGNLLLQTALFTTRPQSSWFQESFGLTGGEDAELTRRFAREGATILWAANADAFETVPKERASLKWLIRRYRRQGSVDYRLGTNTRIMGVAGGLVRIAVGTPALLWSALLFRRMDTKAFKRTFRGVGFVEAALNRGYVEYARKAS